MRKRALGFIVVLLLGAVSACVQLGPTSPVCGSILYQESFGAGTGWTVATYASSRSWIEEGRYRIEVIGDWITVFRWNETEGPFSDFCYSADVWDLSASASNGFGLAVRMTDLNNLYAFQIHPESGSVSMAKRVAGTWSMVVPWQTCSSVHGVRALNELRVIARGGIASGCTSTERLPSRRPTAAWHQGTSALWEVPPTAARQITRSTISSCATWSRRHSERPGREKAPCGHCVCPLGAKDDLDPFRMIHERIAIPLE